MSRTCNVLIGIVLFGCGLQAGQEQTAVVVDKDKRTVTLDAKVAPRKLPHLKGQVYPIEVVACWPHPKGKKAHETVVTIEAKPSDVHKALEALGLKAGTPVMGESATPPQGPKVNIYLDLPGPDGKPRRVPIERALIESRTNKPMPKVEWRFTGSVRKKESPDKDELVYAADLSGTLIAIFPVTNETVFQTGFTIKEEKYVKLETNKAVLPAEGTAVKLVIEVPAGK